MAHVVFLRAVNVVGHQTFRPRELAAQMAEHEVVSIGAAGTFAVRGKIGAAALRAALLDHLPFQPDMAIVPARDVLALHASDPFAAYATLGAKHEVTILTGKPAQRPRLPLDAPAAGDWQLRIFALAGVFALSLRLPAQRLIYPSALIEKHLGVPATTRTWNTIGAICKALQAVPHEART